MRFDKRSTDARETRKIQSPLETWRHTKGQRTRGGTRSWLDHFGGGRKMYGGMYIITRETHSALLCSLYTAVSEAMGGWVDGWMAPSTPRPHPVGSINPAAKQYL